MTWDLGIGQEDSRTDIHDRHGGSSSRGISAAAQSRADRKDVLLWWRPEHGEAFGYVDGWTPDAVAFYFTGTGQRGDQRFEFPLQENGRVRDHAANGDHIRLLKYVGHNQVRYMGELRLDPQDPWRWIDGLDLTQQTRRMIQFRFLPVDVAPIADDERLHEPPAIGIDTEPLQAPPPEPAQTTVEALGREEFKRQWQARVTLVKRTEALLVHEFGAWIDSAHSVRATGLRIPYRPEGRNLRADLWLPDHRVLIEAKATSAREAIRTAIGQLLDYSRYVQPTPALCLLTPDQPAQDMLDLLSSLDISSAWRLAQGTFQIAPAPDWMGEG